MTASGADQPVRYVTWGEYGTGVYESQVTRLVDLLARQVDIELLALVRRGSISRLDPPARGRLLPGPLLSRWPGPTLRLRSAELERELRARSPNGVLHCRGPLATLAALHARRAIPGWRVIHDYRGLDAAEVEEERGPSSWTRRLASLEREACRDADLVSVVSTPLRELVVGSYGVPADRVEVHRTGVETNLFDFDQAAREAARRELGLESGPLLVYVGSAAHWQLADVCVQAAGLLAASRGTTLAVLSQQADVFRDLAATAGLPADRLVARSATRAELGRLLCAADVALLPRRDSQVNAVASPVKFAEYLAAGVPVVTVRGAGPFAEQVEHEQLGMVADAPEPWAIAAAVESILGMGAEPIRTLRAACRDVAARDYDLARVADGYVGAYRRLEAGAEG